MISARRLAPLGLCLALLGCGSASAPSASAGAGPRPPPAPAPPPRPRRPAPLVAAAFEQYKIAALNADGPAAAGLLASDVQGFYDTVRGLALTATERELRARTVSERLTALFMRGSLPPGLLRTGTPAQLIAAAVDAGLIGEDGVRNLTIGDVSVAGDRARAPAVVRGEPATFDLAFSREDGHWKLDLLPLLRTTDAAFEQAARQQGTSVDELVTSVTTKKYGRAKAARLLQPVGR